MIHLKKFSDFLFINESGGILPRKTFFPGEPKYQEGDIPIYNSLKAGSGFSARPEAKVKSENLIEALDILLGLQKDGVLEEIKITADIPTQGKNAPKYLVDELEVERKRLRAKILSRYGGRIEASDYPEIACDSCDSTGKVIKNGEEVDCTVCKGKGTIREAPQEINIFIDTEFILKGIEEAGGTFYIVAIPVSKKRKISRDPQLENYYKTYILPKQVLEVEFDPY